MCRRNEAQEEKNLGLQAKLGDEFFQDSQKCGDMIEEKGSILEHNAIFKDIDQGIQEHLMFADDDTHARSSKDPCEPTVDRDSVSDELLGKVHQTYDACARLRSNISHCGEEFMRVVGLMPEGIQTVKQGLALSKNIMLEANAIITNVV